MVQEEACCLGKSVDVAVGEWVYCAVERFGYYFYYVVHAADDEVALGSHWHFNVGQWEPGDSVGVAFGFGFPNPNSVASVVFVGWAEVPGV